MVNFMQSARDSSPGRCEPISGDKNMNENKSINSLERYQNLNRHKNSGVPIRFEELEGIFTAMQEELLVDGFSPLYNAVCISCSKRYQREFRSWGINWFQHIGKEIMSAYEAERWILCMGAAVGGNLSREMLVYLLNGNERDTRYRWRDIQQALVKISQWVNRKRGELAARKREEAAARQQTAAPVREQEPRQETVSKQEPREEEQKVLSEARRKYEEILKDAEKKRQEILDSAHREAAELKAEAQRKNAEAEKLQAEAARWEAEARQRAARVTADVLDSRYAREQEEAMHSLDTLRQAVVAVNTQMRAVETMLTEANTRKASRQLLDLYDVIADLRDTNAERMKDDPTGACGDTVCNMEAFLFMITDALSEYGITNINTLPGAPFNGKFHEVYQCRAFDPRRAVVARSLRDGFAWGDQVIRKEKIILKEEERDGDVSWN